MFEEVLKTCKGKEVHVQQVIRAGATSKHYCGMLIPARSWDISAFCHLDWCVREKNVIMGFSNSEVVEVLISSPGSGGQNITIYLKKTTLK